MNGKIKHTYEQYWHERIRVSVGEENKEKKVGEIFDTVSSVLNTGNRLLDVGCGDGGFALKIKDKFSKIYGAEIAKEAALIARKQNVSASLVDLNLSLSYQNNIFDAVTCLDVIEHLLDPDSFIEEIYRVLKPAGQLVLTTPNIRNFRNLYTLVFKGIFPQTSPDTFVWGGGHLHFFTREDIKSIFKKAGFKRIEFSINQNQFRLSKKRKIIHCLTGEKTFGEWFCASITISAYKES
ncbi:MAG: class I SAM-dependent methyltransferase [Candidatus Scalindua sp.]|jgi:2-polyprenyl-3-methyl-5-hydroxy-6-metoxy-1,4-benzoquinol methylase|nr:class I SAM-dependent methyltransferase [Candidatus Scalindua sp.]